MSAQQNGDPDIEAIPRLRDGLREPNEQPLALVVDDEPLVRHLICSILSRLGWRTLEAADGPQALLVGADTDIDLLITDYEMPGIKGIEVADVFRSRLADLPVFVVSGLETVGPLATSSGYRFLAKPFGPGELWSLVTGLAARPTRDTDGGPQVHEVPEAGESTRIGHGSEQPPGRYGSFSGRNSRPVARGYEDRPIGTPSCTLRCFPRDDPQFEADANRILAECKRTPTWAGVLEQVRDRMVQLYPGAVVNPRSLLAANGDPNEYWYCSRDGRLSLCADR